MNTSKFTQKSVQAVQEYGEGCLSVWQGGDRKRSIFYMSLLEQEDEPDC